MKTKGAHEIFSDLLESYKLDEQYIIPFRIQLLKTFQNMKAETFLEREELKKKIKVQEQELDILDERFAYGKFDDEILYHRLRVRKQQEINLINEKMEGTEDEISNLEFYIEKSIELSQNIHKHWQLGALDVKKKIQELVFPEGIVVDTKNRTYLTSKVNSLFLAKSQFMRTSGGINKKLPINSDEESW